MEKDSPERREDLGTYFNDIADSEPLPREREKELATRVRKGDREARNELVRANLRYVVSVARQYEGRGLGLGDLISAGNLGLIRAAESFDGSKGFKFITYAVWWIRQGMLEAIANEARTVRLPMNKIQLLNNIGHATESFQQQFDREPEEEEVAEMLPESVQSVRETLRHVGAIHSLDAALEEGDNRTFLDVLPVSEQNSPEVEVERKSNEAFIAHFLDYLNERERFVLQRYFGLDGEGGLTLRKIGQHMGLTRERVRQIKEGALEKCRHPARLQRLQAFKEEIVRENTRPEEWIVG